MKKFYLHNGTDQHGPFDIEELKTKNITTETFVWYEGISEWTAANNVEELKDLFKTVTPPLFVNKANIPPSFQQATNIQQPTQKNKNTLGIVLQSIGAVGVIAIIAVIITANMYKGGSTNPDPQTYQEKVMTIEEIERSQPINFLSATGSYNLNFWGDKIKIHGVITNTATVATFKDAVVKVTYFSKTKTALGNKNYHIYETFPPHSKIKFELKIENYKNVSTVGLEVIQATVQ